MKIKEAHWKTLLAFSTIGDRYHNRYKPDVAFLNVTYLRLKIT